MCNTSCLPCIALVVTSDVCHDCFQDVQLVRYKYTLGFCPSFCKMTQNEIHISRCKYIFKNNCQMWWNIFPLVCCPWFFGNGFIHRWRLKAIYLHLSGTKTIWYSDKSEQTQFLLIPRVLHNAFPIRRDGSTYSTILH